MNDIRRLPYVTEHHPHLEGLRVVPLGMPFWPPPPGGPAVGLVAMDRRLGVPSCGSSEV
jgi:hypothetical protein